MNEEIQSGGNLVSIKFVDQLPPILVVTKDGQFQWAADAAERIESDTGWEHEPMRHLIRALWQAKMILAAPPAGVIIGATDTPAPMGPSAYDPTKIHITTAPPAPVSRADGWFLPRASLSGLAAKSLDDLIRRAKWCSICDVDLRENGKNVRFEADWIKYLTAAQSAPLTNEGGSEPVAWIEHHKGGDNLVWDDPGGNRSPLYARQQPVINEGGSEPVASITPLDSPVEFNNWQGRHAYAAGWNACLAKMARRIALLESVCQYADSVCGMLREGGWLGKAEALESRVKEVLDFGAGHMQPAAINEGGKGDWLPTAENVNALPEGIRQYVHNLETRCDPPGEVVTNALLRDHIRMIEADNKRLREGGKGEGVATYPIAYVLTDADHMAKCFDALDRALHERETAVLEREESDGEGSSERIEAASETVYDIMGSMRRATHEYRKRAERYRASTTAPQPSKGEGVALSDPADQDRIAAEQDAAPQPIKGDGTAWSVTGATVRILATELIRAAESMGEDSDELTLAVKQPGTVADDDGATNQRHILAVSLTEYPEEGVYPIDPADPTGGRVDKSEPVADLLSRLQTTISGAESHEYKSVSVANIRAAIEVIAAQQLSADK